MLTDNTGYLKFAGVVNHIVATGSPTQVLVGWYGRRWSQLAGELRDLCETHATDEFVDKYADALAIDLWHLLQAHAETVKEAAPINAAETLLAQARLYAETEAREPAPAPTPDPVLPDILETAANPVLACAA